MYQNILANMFFVLTILTYLSAVALSGKSNIFIKTARESSIRMDVFVSMLEVTFNTTNCCNVLRFGKSTTTENLLKEFFRVYPRSHTLNQQTYDCNGYLVISTSVNGLMAEMKSVPTTMATTELLIFLDRDIEESTGVFNVSIYDQANVNIVAPNGLWTHRKDFLESAFFEKVSSHHEIPDTQRIVNLQGRELTAAALHEPPFCYLRSTEIGTVKGIEGQHFNAKNKSEVDGIEMKLFMLIAERLNSTWTISTPKDNERYGQPSKTGWDGGIIGQLVDKEVHVAFTEVWFTEDKYQVTNLTVPWGVVFTNFLVPRPKPHTSAWALTRSLSPEVWWAILAMLIVQSICVCTIAWLVPKTSRRFRNFAVTLTELMGMLIGSWYPTKVQGLLLRLLLQLWTFVGILLVIAYSNNLAADLTNLRYEKRIDTTQDFIVANLTWGHDESTWRNQFLFDQSDPYVIQLIKQFEPENGVADRHIKILRGNYAILGRTISSIFFPQGEVMKEDLKGFRLMHESTSSFQLAFAVEPWLLESVNAVMLRLQETGLVEYHVKDVLRRRTESELREVLVEHDGYEDGPRVLRLAPLSAAFLVLIFGIFTSSIVFLCELMSVRNKRSIRQVFLDIKKNRAIWHDIELRRKREDSIYRKLRGRKFVCTIPQ